MKASLLEKYRNMITKKEASKNKESSTLLLNTFTEPVSKFFLLGLLPFSFPPSMFSSNLEKS